MSLSSAPPRGSKEMESFEYDPSIARPAASSSAAGYDTALATASRAYAASLKPEDEHALVSEPFDPKLAFQVFAGTAYAPSHVSSSVSPAATSSSSGAQQPSAAIVAATTSAHAIAAFETPQERLVRLKRDIAAFKADLAVLTARQQASEAVSAGAAGAAGGSAPLAVAGSIQNELDALAADLSSPSLAATAASAASGGAAAASGSSGAGLAASLTALSIAPASTTTTTAGAAGASATGSKGLPPVPVSASDLLTADRRLAQLEKLIGTARASDFPYPDLCTALASLGQQVEALDVGRIERVVRRVRGLAAEVEALGVRRQQAAEAAAKAKAAAAAAASAAGPGATAPTIATSAGTAEPQADDDDEDGDGNGLGRSALQRMQHTLQKWDAVADTVPALVARLQSLKAVHAETAQAVARAAAVSERHAQAEAEARAGKEAVAALTAAVEENAKVMGGNVEMLQERMRALAEKVDKLLAQG